MLMINCTLFPILLQILSMKNGLNLHSMYLSGGLQPFRTSQTCVGFGLNGNIAMNNRTGMLPLNQDSPVQSSFDLSNQCTTIKSSLINVTNLETPLVNPLESQCGSVQVPVSCEVIFFFTYIPLLLQHGIIEESILNTDIIKELCMQIDQPVKSWVRSFNVNHFSSILIGNVNK